MAARPPAALCAALVLSAVWLASATTEEPPSPNGDAPPTILEQVGRPAAPPVLLRRLSPPLVARVQLPLLAASCVAAGFIASQAVYYDDDGDPTGLDQIPGGDRQAKLFGLWVGCGLFVLGCGGLWFQSLHTPPH